MKRLRISIPAIAVLLFSIACSEEDSGSPAPGSSTNGPATGPSGSQPGVSPSTSGPGGMTGSTAGPGGMTGSTAGPGGMTGSTAGPGGMTGSTAGPGGMTGSTAGPGGMTGSTAGPGGTTGPSPTTTDQPGPVQPGPVQPGPVQPGPVQPVPVDPAPSLITSGQNSYWQVGEVTEATGNATITVNDGQTYQTWHGFGGSVNELGWKYLLELNETERVRAMKLLFDRNEGAAFRYVRIPIGASDFAEKRYTLNDNAGDYAMEKFSITRDETYLIPFIKAAMAVNPNIHFSASPWTPPPWMKSNNAYDGVVNGSANIKDDDQTFQALALYLARFVEEYAKHDIEVKAVYPQNEPGFANQAYPMCGWTGAQMTKFIGQFMGPTFKERGLTAEIWMGTMSNTATDGGIGQAVMADATAKGYVKAFGMQWEMSTLINQFTTYNLPIWQSEHKCGNYPWNPAGAPTFNPNNAPNDHAYATESWGYIKDWINRGANGYMAWNMVLDTVGKSLDTNRVWPQNALLTVDTGGKKLNLTPTYHVFRHVSQYVEDGAKRVGVSQGADAVAFKNPDGSIVAVVHNGGGQASQQTLSAAGKTVQFSVPANGWATVNLEP